MPTPSAAAATPGLAFAAAEPPPQAPLPGPCWRSRGARPTCAPLTQQTPPRRPSDPLRVEGVSSGHANARGGAGRRGTRPPPHVHGPCRCHCRCVPARWSTEHFPNNNCAACKCRLGTSKAAAPMRLSMPGTELRPGADRAATWKRGGSAWFSAENDRLVSCRYCWYFSREKAASERVLPYFPRTKLGSRTQQTVRALQNLYCSGQPMPWGYLCYHYIVRTTFTTHTMSQKLDYLKLLNACYIEKNMESISMSLISNFLKMHLENVYTNF